MSEVNKYAEAFKAVVQKILIRLDPALVNDFIQIYAEEIQRMEGVEAAAPQDRVNISIDNSSGVSITTGGVSVDTSTALIDGVRE